jgi:hypothetical protein
MARREVRPRAHRKRVGVADRRARYAHRPTQRLQSRMRARRHTASPTCQTSARRGASDASRRRGVPWRRDIRLRAVAKLVILLSDGRIPHKSCTHDCTAASSVGIAAARVLSSVFRELAATALLDVLHVPPKHFSRDSPDESQTGVNIRAFPAFPQDSREVRTATGASGSPNGGAHRRNHGRAPWREPHFGGFYGRGRWYGRR